MTTRIVALHATLLLLAACGGSDGDRKGDGLSWSTVTADVEAIPGHGYEVDAPGRVTIALPPDGDLLPGDAVAVRAAGAGGFRVTAAPGQRLRVGAAVLFPGVTWTAPTGPPALEALASSADGLRLLGAVLVGGVEGQPASGQLHTSADGGSTWTPCPSAGDLGWTSVASSADGAKLVALSHDRRLFRSVNGGQTWAPLPGPPFLLIGSSADGSRLVALSDGRHLHRSLDGGQTWAAAGDSPTDRSWGAVASSASGEVLLAAQSSGYLWASTDGGEHWTVSGPRRIWTAVAAAADGVRLVAAADEGWIYTSADSGQTWRQRGTARGWRDVAISADGTKLVAIERAFDRALETYAGHAHVSADAGLTWTARGPELDGRSVASSADGSRLLVLDSRGVLHRSAPDVIAGGEAVLVEGGQGAEVRLVYAGDGAYELEQASGALLGW